MIFATLPDPITAAWHAGFVSGVMVTALVLVVGWVWKRWGER